MKTPLEPAAADGLTLYLYGDRNPQISASMVEPGFRDLLRLLFDGEEARLPEPSPPGLETAVESGLLRVDGGRFRPGPRLVVIPAHAEESAPGLMRPAFAQYVEIAQDVTAQLAELYSGCAAADRFSWDEVVHTLVAGMFLDLAMGMQVYRSRTILRRPVGDSVVWAFERMSGQNAYGVQWFATPRHRAFVAQLWHRDVRRAELRLNRAMVDLLVRTATGGSGGGEEGPPDPKDALYLRHLRFLTRRGGDLALQVPVFGPEDTARMLPVLEDGARRLVEYAVTPALEALAFDPWWRGNVRKDSYRHAAVRLALEYGIDCTVGSKVLPPFPEGECTPAWGRWVWIEPEGPRTLIPSVATREAEVPDA